MRGLFVFISIVLFILAFFLLIGGFALLTNPEAGIIATIVFIIIGAVPACGGVLLLRKAQKLKKAEPEKTNTALPPQQLVKPITETAKLEKSAPVIAQGGKNKGKTMSIMDIFHISQYKAAIESQKKEIGLLQQTMDEIGATDAVTVKAKIEEYRQIESILKNSCNEIRAVIDKLQEEAVQKRNEILVIDETMMLESFALYQPKFKFTSSEEYKNRLEHIREKQKDTIKNDNAASGGEKMTFNGSLKEGQKMIADIKKLFIRSFNNECDYCVDNVKFSNIDASEKRIEKSFETINKLGRLNGVNLTEVYKKLKFEELYLAFEYQKKKEQEKEEAKRAREELREQQKLEREIREAREKIEKEKKHFTVAIKELEEKLKKTSDSKEIELIMKNLEETRGKYSELEKEEKVVDYREQNAKAGYVYVISNIGAFGENVYKIGMTRRLEPMDRVDELGDASVPFSFDVHAMVFSDNAPELEAKLHEYFYSSRINKINDRKEFFRADLSEIEKIIKENYNKVVDVVKEAPAEQYRESLLIK